MDSSRWVKKGYRVFFLSSSNTIFSLGQPITIMLHARLLLLLTAVLPTTTAFQFMKGWKMPTHDPHAEAVQEKFGDKSAY